jgi:hypothetical protein
MITKQKYLQRVVRDKRKMRAQERLMTIDERIAVMNKLRNMLTLVTGRYI